MSTIDEIMQAVYRSQLAASAYEASSGPGTGKLEIDMFAADGEVQAMITEALAEARREGAEAMRESAADAGYAAAFSDENGADVADAIRALPLPTGKRQAVRLTDEQALAALPDCHGSSLGKNWLLTASRAIESAVLAANGLGEAK